MNILVTALGSMSALPVINSLKNNPDINIIGTDIHPGKYLYQSRFVDKFYQVPNAADAAYIKKIVEIVEEEKIQFIIPLIDYEVDVLNSHRKKFEKLNATVTISNEKAINTCRDKLKLYNFFKNSGNIQCIPIIQKEDLNGHLMYPVVAKLINGRSSEGLHFIHSYGELMEIAKQESYIVQPKIVGSIYTVDVVRDVFGNCVSVARKELKRTSNGAGLSVSVEANEHLTALSAFIAESLDILGCINIEFIFDGNTFLLMDINPRFSAGISFSKAAGYDMVNNHMKCFLNKPIERLIGLKQNIYFKIFQDYI